MEDLTITGGLLAMLFAIVGFFLRVLHKDLKDVIAKSVKLEGKLFTMEREIQANKEIQQAEISTIRDVLSEIKDDFKSFMSRQRKTEDIIISIHTEMTRKNK